MVDNGVAFDLDGITVAELRAPRDSALFKRLANYARRWQRVS